MKENIRQLLSYGKDNQTVTLGYNLYKKNLDFFYG